MNEENDVLPIIDSILNQTFILLLSIYHKRVYFGIIIGMLALCLTLLTLIHNNRIMYFLQS
jgi:hypothetical protein